MSPFSCILLPKEEDQYQNTLQCVIPTATTGILEVVGTLKIWFESSTGGSVWWSLSSRNPYQSDGRGANGSLSILRPNVNYQLWHRKYLLMCVFCSTCWLLSESSHSSFPHLLPSKMFCCISHKQYCFSLDTYHVYFEDAVKMIIIIFL